MRTGVMIMFVFAVVILGVFLLVSAGGGGINPEPHVGGSLP